MEIENGEYFVVSRGLELNSSNFSILGFMSEPKEDTKPRYDRSYDGLLFQAKSTCHPHVACVCIASSCKRHEEYIGRAMMFNQLEVELMTVDKAFVDTFKINQETTQ